jgi:hypothetical protein
MDWASKPARVYVTYQVGLLFLKMLFIWAAHRALTHCLVPLFPFAYLPPTTFKLFGLPIFWLWGYKTNQIKSNKLYSNYGPSRRKQKLHI